MAVELAGKEGTVKALPMDNVPGLTLPSDDGAGEQNRWLAPVAMIPSPAAWGGVSTREAFGGEPSGLESVNGGPICDWTVFLCKVLVFSMLAQELGMEGGRLGTGTKLLWGQELGPVAFSVFTMMPTVWF